MLFTDAYGEQSCTAGRSSFITGQSVYRTGLSKVGIPGAPVGMNEKIVTIAALLKEQGYATGQFGKNHCLHASREFASFSQFVNVIDRPNTINIEKNIMIYAFRYRYPSLKGLLK